MRFIVQKIQNRIVHDFAFTLTMAKDYYKWLGEQFIIRYVNWPVPNETPILHPENYIPVGSVDFVSDYLKKYYPDAVEALRPLNVPEVLFPWAGRMIANIETRGDMEPFRSCTDIYRKSNETIKAFWNGPVYDVWKDYESKDFVHDQVSEIIDLVSEWRVFVFHNEIQHIANYGGYPTWFPSVAHIEEMVARYAGAGAPVAYTLDVGVKKDGQTVVVECHRFFSCGLYGFANLMKYPKMLSQEWYEMIHLNDI